MKKNGGFSLVAIFIAVFLLTSSMANAEENAVQSAPTAPKSIVSAKKLNKKSAVHGSKKHKAEIKAKKSTKKASTTKKAKAKLKKKKLPKVVARKIKKTKSRASSHNSHKPKAATPLAAYEGVSTAPPAPLPEPDVNQNQ